MEIEAQPAPRVASPSRPKPRALANNSCNDNHQSGSDARGGSKVGHLFFQEAIRLESTSGERFAWSPHPVKDGPVTPMLWAMRVSLRYDDF